MASMNFATVIFTLTPTDGTAPLTLKSDTTWDEEEFLSEAQPARERLKRFMSNDGQQDQTINNFASNGTRDCQFFDSPVLGTDTLLGWAARNPTVPFNMDVRYQLDEQDASTVRIQRHLRCKSQNTPARVLHNQVAVIKFTINYGQLQNINAATGQPVS